MSINTRPICLPRVLFQNLGNLVFVLAQIILKIPHNFVMGVQLVALPCVVCDSEGTAGLKHEGYRAGRYLHLWWWLARGSVIFLICDAVRYLDQLMILAQ